MSPLADPGGWIGSPKLPEKGETAAVALMAPKTAALFYDRVWGTQEQSRADQPGRKELWLPPAVSGGTVPEEVRFGGGPLDTVFASFVGGIPAARDEAAKAAEPELRELWEAMDEGTKVMSPKVIANHFNDTFSFYPVPVYDSDSSLKSDFTEGDESVLVPMLTNIDVVDEDALDWKQVVQFRDDPSAKRKLRRLRHWLDGSMVGKPVSFVEDELAIRLEDYATAIRAHGIKTKIGVMSELVSVENILTTVAAGSAAMLLGGPILGAAAFAAITVYEIRVQILRSKVDLMQIKAGPNSEVAYLHEIKQLSSKGR